MSKTAKLKKEENWTQEVGKQEKREGKKSQKTYFMSQNEEWIQRNDNFRNQVNNIICKLGIYWWIYQKRIKKINNMVYS